MQEMWYIISMFERR